jgi:AP2-associated kinase
LKVENVLIASSRCYKLCDFGSAATPRAAGTTAQECRAIEEDIQKHTTLQYRSPEMVDVYRRLPIDEKSDIWALGVFLYKLCYYTTPFEDKGTLAILNAKFVFPPFPSYSTKIKNLIGMFQGNGLTIAWTLRENPKDRPNIYEVVKAVCILRGSEVPIRDVFSFPSLLTQDLFWTDCYTTYSPSFVAPNGFTACFAPTVDILSTCQDSCFNYPH